MTAGYLCTLHNISWMHQYIRAIRNAIETGEQALFDLKQKIIAVYT